MNKCVLQCQIQIKFDQIPSSAESSSHSNSVIGIIHNIILRF